MRTAPTPERVAEVSRRLRARADGFVAELWFMPESQTGYPTLGIGGASGDLRRTHRSARARAR